MKGYDSHSILAKKKSEKVKKITYGNKTAKTFSGGEAMPAFLKKLGP